MSSLIHDTPSQKELEAFRTSTDLPPDILSIVEEYLYDPVQDVLEFAKGIDSSSTIRTYHSTYLVGIYCMRISSDKKNKIIFLKSG